MTPTPDLPSYLRGRTIPSLAAVESLIDQLPYPTLLVNQSTHRIILVNAEVTSLTAFTRQELSSQNLEALFTQKDVSVLLDSASSSTPLDTVINRRNAPPLSVRARPFTLDNNGRWTLLSVEPASISARREAGERRQANIEQVIQSFVSAFTADHPEAALSLALEAASQFTGASILAIYQAAGDALAFKRSAAHGMAEMLPEQILPNDLHILHAPILWTSKGLSKGRAYSSLHRAARSANLSYLASVPLGEPDAVIGLLAAANEYAEPFDSLLDDLRMIAMAISAIMQAQARTSALKDQLQQARRSAAAGAAVQENVQDGILVLDTELRLIEMNPAAETILGYATRDVRGEPCQNLLIGADNLVPPFINIDSNATFHDLGNVRLYRRDGRPFLAHVRTLPIVVSGKLENLVILVQDLSQEEQFRIQNQQLEQRALLGQFSGMFAHEVRNPINNISTGLQLLAINITPDNPNYALMNRLQQDVDRLAQLVNSALAFVRTSEYKFAPVDLEFSLRRLVERWKTAMTRANIQSSIIVEAGTPPVLGDSHALEQVWNNLINNAIQAMEQQGGALTIKIRTAAPVDGDHQVEVSVIDSGPGIPDEAREHLFEPFYTTKRNGTGLGLAITQSIITSHKGTIRVTSIPGGTVFHVLLPVYHE